MASGGLPSVRVHARPLPELLLPQDQSRAWANPAGAPGLVDYLYMSFINATAFSARDVVTPLRGWAKRTMMLFGSAVCLAAATLVLARAVGFVE